MACGARCHPTWHESAEGTRVSEPWLVELRCAACTAQVTTSMNPSKYIEEFLAEMVELLPNSEYRKRGKCPVKEMCDAAVKRGFTNLLIFTNKTYDITRSYLISFQDLHGILIVFFFVLNFFFLLFTT